MEVVHPRDGDVVTLRACPPWCVQDRHFTDGQIIDAEDGFHHCGAETEVKTSYPYLSLADGPATIVRVVLKSWTHPLDAASGPALIELSIGTAGERTGACAEVTPEQARTIAQALLDHADTVLREGRNANPR